MVQLSHSYVENMNKTGKTIALTKWTFVGKVISQKFVGWRRGRKDIHFQGGEATHTKVKGAMSRVCGAGMKSLPWRVDGSRGEG